MNGHKPWVFNIEYTGGVKRAFADTLTVTEVGAVKLWLRGKQVGVLRHNDWTRVYISADQTTGNSEVGK